MAQVSSTDNQDIEITTSPSESAIDQAQMRESQRVGSKLAAFDITAVKIVDLTSGSASNGALAPKALSSGLTRSQISSELVTSPAGINHEDVILCLVGSERTPPIAEIVNAKPNEIILALQAFDNHDQTRWVDLVKVNAELLIMSGYKRDLAFSSVRGAAYLARYVSTNAAPSPEALVRYEVALAKSEFTSVDLSDPGAHFTSESEVLALRNALSVAEAKAQDAVQSAYVAQDALAGANAEKARAVGVATEREYQASLQHKEISSMVDQLDNVNKRNRIGSQSPTLRSRVRQTALGAALARVTAPIRHRN